MTGLRIMIAGDLHLGRSSSRVRPDGGVDVSARGAWHRLVDATIREGADLLCLTGDVADEHNRYWEALGPLEEGIRRLREHRVRTLAVSGNHDHDVLPRLAARLDPEAFRLLGAGGTWERFTHSVDGQPVLHVDGWSFAQESVRTSPIASYASTGDVRIPVLGMVHGDLDVPESPYAPLARRELLACPVAGWMLGHIHAPLREEVTGRPFITYPGSPQALDPGEPGPHGAVLLELRDGHCAPLRVVPLSSVRYESLAIDLSDVDAGEVDGRVLDAIDDCAAASAASGGDGLAALSLRLRLVGRTSLTSTRRADLEASLGDLDRTSGGIRVTVDGVRVAVRPPIDLAEHAAAATPPGRLAQLLLDLDDDRPDDARDPRAQRLLDEARQRIEAQRADRTYRDITAADRAPGDQEVRRLVREQAEALLARLLEQST